jgi:hypothetical protein
VGETEAKDRAAEAPNVLFSFLHLAVLSTFALAQPLFDLLSDNPEFFAARGSTAADVIVFAILLVVLPPALLLAVELLIGLAGPTARRVAHLVLVALLAAVIFVQAIKDAIDASDVVMIVLALALGGLAALLYARAEPIRSFLSVLSPAPLVFLVLFLFISPVHKITLSSDATAKEITGIDPVPIVMVIFDELPSMSLLDDRNQVDPVRYPGFAQLQKDGTWFRNAHSIYDATAKAVPAIMDGNYPEKGVLPTSSDHPNSIFTLLGNSHRMNVSEEATTICPRDLCEDERLDESFLDRLGSMTDDLSLVYAHVVAPPGIEADLDTVSETWGDFGGGEGGEEAHVEEEESPKVASRRGKRETLANLRADRSGKFDAWIAAIKDTRRPSLNFKHALLPHVPWKYLPTGQLYNERAGDPIPNLSRESFGDKTQVEQLQMRHLLQLGFADSKIQKLIEHLKRLGMYDKSLIVVTADHGVAFRQGLFDRRLARYDDWDQIAAVPLFIKQPRQKRARIDDSIVETTDIVPTIADVVNLTLPEKTDGKSAFSEAVRKRTKVRMLSRDFSTWFEASREEFAKLKQDDIDRKLEVFGTGAEGPDRIFRVGPNQHLIGRSVDAMAAGRSELRMKLTDPGAWNEVDTDGPFLPLWITGRLQTPQLNPVEVAFAVDGTVRSVATTFRLAFHGDSTYVATLVPPSALHDGRNEVAVYEVRPGDRLALMGSN